MEEKKYLKWYNKVGYGSGDIAFDFPEKPKPIETSVLCPKCGRPLKKTHVCCSLISEQCAHVSFPILT